MDGVINAPGYGNNVVGVINARYKFYLKKQMEHIVKLARNDTSKIGIVPSDSKGVYITFLDQCIHILNNKEILNGLKGSTKMQKKESIFKYQSHIYNVQRNYGVNCRVMKMRLKKRFPSLNVINGKTPPYGS